MEKSPAQIFEELLVLKCQSGDERSLSILIKRWHPKLIRQANRHLYDLDASKDVVQESWQAIIKGLNVLKDSSKFGVWALSITSRKAIDWIRKKQTSRKREEDDVAFHQEQLTEPTDEKEVLLSKVSLALKGLPKDQKLVLSMFYLDSHSLIEIGKILDLPVGTVKSRLYYAREHLKKMVINKH
jgi:RNA polymerase sigma-70 factor (ECF subfamily)